MGNTKNLGNSCSGQAAGIVKRNMEEACLLCDRVGFPYQTPAGLVLHLGKAENMRMSVPLRRWSRLGWVRVILMI